MLARGILVSGRTGRVSSRPFPNSSGWWWLISSIFLIRISCHKTTYANGYYGAWPGWAVSISVLPLTKLLLGSARSPRTTSSHSLLLGGYSSVVQWCLTLWGPMDCHMPVFPVLHHLLEFAQIHDHGVSVATQPSHPHPSPPAFSLSQHQSLFQWVGSSSGGQTIRVSASASVFQLNI